MCTPLRLSSAKVVLLAHPERRQQLGVPPTCHSSSEVERCSGEKPGPVKGARPKVKMSVNGRSLVTDRVEAPRPGETGAAR
eukprot:525986-Heterocapsa_arctica.AAC.1